MTLPLRSHPAPTVQWLALLADSFRIYAGQALRTQGALALYPCDPDTATALVLHRVLTEADPRQTYFFISGERCRPDFETHAWIELGNLIIDVTGKKLGCPDAVAITSSRDWHGTFSITDKRHSLYNEYEDRSDIRRLDALYQQIRTCLSPVI